MAHLFIPMELTKNWQDDEKKMGMADSSRHE
jgi:hypothetical protein